MAHWVHDFALKPYNLNSVSETQGKRKEVAPNSYTLTCIKHS